MTDNVLAFDYILIIIISWDARQRINVHMYISKYLNSYKHTRLKYENSYSSLQILAPHGISLSIYS